MARLRAFTLIELLLAIVLLATVCALLFGLFFQTKKNQQVTTSVLKNRQDLRVLRSMLSADLKAAVYLKQWATTGNQSGLIGINKVDGTAAINQIYFHVREPSLNFHLSSTQGDPQVHEVAYYIRKIAFENQYSLYRREYFYVRANFPLVEDIFSSEMNLDPREQATLVTDRILSLSVGYLPTNDASAANWLKSWDSNLQNPSSPMPVAIYIALSLKGKDGQALKDDFQINLKPSLPSASQWGY